MVAGSESGAVIASTIAGPKKKFATEAVKYFNKTVETVYAERSMGIGFKILFSIMILAAFFLICLAVVYKCCYNNRRNEYIEELLDFIKASKKVERVRMTAEGEGVELDKDEL